MRFFCEKAAGYFVIYMDDRRFEALLGGRWMLEDRLLVLRCRRGSREAMCRIYEKYKDYLLTVARALLYDRMAAEDVVHDVFVSFAGSVKTFRLTGSLKSYLTTCVVNLARDQLRARKRQMENLDPASCLASASNSPSQQAMEAEELARLRRALTELPAEQREAVVMRIKGRMRFREIARLHRISIASAHRRYADGLDRLRSLLDAEESK